MEKKSSFLRTYLIVVVVFGFLGLLDSILSILDYTFPEYTSFISILALGFFIYNIIALIIFVKRQLERITFVLPIYHITLYVLFFGIGVYTAYQANRDIIFFYSAIIGVVSSIFEIVFAFYLLKKFELI